ncbi:MAG: hypothetical protein MUP81_00575, partial [Dehalococcoidia bacterium]|nr:hypothetical protein [Dehalococcoidia bacterium]
MKLRFSFFKDFLAPPESARPKIGQKSAKNRAGEKTVENNVVKREDIFVFCCYFFGFFVPLIRHLKYFLKIF